MTIRKTVRVARPPDIAFKIFVEEIGRWWPNEKYMFLGAESKATIEARVRGRVYNGHPRRPRVRHRRCVAVSAGCPADP